MVIIQVIKTGIALAPHLKRGLKIYSKYESKVFTRLYGQSRGRGVRHGLAAGSAVGSLISGDNLSGDNGSVPYFNGNKTRPSSKARGGFSQYSTKGYKSAYSTRKGRGCPSPRKYSRSRNRF